MSAPAPRTRTDTPQPAGPRTASLDRLFRAETVALIGASADPGKIGGRPMVLLKEHFQGRVVPVNPKRDEVAGIPAVPDIGSLDATPDVAVLAVPGAAVEATVRDCLDAGVGRIVVYAAGFGEIDADGLAAQRRIAGMCADAGARLLGPNSLGYINFHTGLHATFSAALDNIWPKAGNVAIASQSGAVGTYIMALAAERGIGFSHFVATGNEADIDVADCIAWLAGDPLTEVIVAYLEGCGDGGRLKQALAAARAANKPVIAIKPGASDIGQAAVQSHTGAMAGSKRVFDAVLRHYGAWPATRIEEAVDIAYACSVAAVPSGPAATIVTPSGGVGIMLADACEAAGLALPAPPPATAAEIRALLPLASTGNPVDTTAQVTADFRLFGKVLDIVADGTACPILLIFMAHMGKTPGVTDLLRPTLTDIAERHRDRLMVLITRAADDFRADMEAQGYLVFEDPTRAVGAVAALRYFGRGQDVADDPLIEIAPVGRTDLDAAAREAVSAAALLRRIGVPDIATVAVSGEDEAVDAAGRAGFPVVLKIDSPDIAHKTEVGGVHLGLKDADAVRSAWRSMMARVTDAAPSARITGGIVSPMLGEGIDTIVGARQDPDLGPVVMLGLGGIMAEALDDVVIAPAPIGMASARAMIGRLRAAAVLDGWRGAAPTDKDALARAICALGALVAANGEDIDSIEINPFRVFPDGGAALDILVRTKEGPATD
ncbi:acetate--CoA ligase family protein [Microbaculum marinum]|uniref:Acetate--CoA ligase family protein n=1 Tax=Microbaculum marinum TaxID=1764581 RepID=A0AAW9RTD9_9HYPH